jgi:thiosulfate dehydrogenase (quinone) large subunit
MTAAYALAPLRIFLGATFAYAGVQKLADPGFLHPGAPSYVGDQLRGFARDAPAGWLLDTFAAPHPAAAGVAVAVTEIAIGVVVLAGRWVRVAAACGLALNLLLFLTASWHASPYFLGADVVFVFAWLPFVLLDEREQPAAVPRVRGLTRRAALAQLAAATAALAGVATLARGDYEPPARAARRRPRGARPLARADAVRPGSAVRVDTTAGPALLVRGEDGSVHGLSATCTHEGCEVEARGDVLACPCHGARFDAATGAVVHGPARRPLEPVAVVERDGGVYAA